VLLVSHATGAHVLAVLERDEGARVKAVLDGDLEIQLKKGRFVVAAQEGIDLVAAKDVSLTSSGVSVRASHGSVLVDKLSLLGSMVSAEIDKVKVLAGALDTIAERVHQRVKRAYRVVEELDQVKAAQIDYSAEKTMNLHAKNALVTAEELVKVDGEQIHLG
jgi:nitrous oxide reductase